MDVVKVCSLALICTIAAVVLQRAKPEYGVLVKLAAAVAFGTAAIALAGKVYGYISGISAYLPGTEYISVLLKALGVAFLTHVCAGICRDCGEGGIASGVELVGKLEILILCFPLISEVFETVGRILSW